MSKATLRITVALLAVMAPVGIASAQRADLDILFVIDNEGSMAPAQTAFVQAFPSLIAELDQTATGRPSLHIGVVSSDVGIGGYSQGGCSGDGDNGRLQNAARASGSCETPNGAFIQDELSPARLPSTNYDGELADVFTCIAQLGTSGCGLEQHLEATKRALDGRNNENSEFLRAGAYLAVIILAGDDDCSAEEPNVFDPSQDSLADPLGPFGSFRCAEFGVWCGGPIARSAASYTGCTAMADSDTNYIYHPSHYADFLKSLAADDPNRVYVGVIAGDPEPFNVVVDTTYGEPYVHYSCESAGGEIKGDPSVRFRSLVQQFDSSRAELVSICNDDLSGPLGVIGAEIRGMLEGPPPTPDAGPGGPGADDDAVDCGCQAGGPPSGGALFILSALVVLVRRRRRRIQTIR